MNLMIYSDFSYSTQENLQGGIRRHVLEVMEVKFTILVPTFWKNVDFFANIGVFEFIGEFVALFSLKAFN